VIFRSCLLGNDELRVIAAIASMHKSLRYALSFPSRWEGTLRRNALARAIRGSNSIAGLLVTAEDAIAAAEGGEPREAIHETWLAIIGYRDAMTYVLQLAKDPNFVFNEGFLRSLHFMMLRHDLTKHPGNWRPGSIFVRGEKAGETVYEGPPAASVRKLISELVVYVNGRKDADHVLVKAAMAHLNLAMIHPFSDGNGRMARCLQTLVLSREGLVDPTLCSIEEYLGRNTEDYYKVLAEVGRGQWHPENDARPWIRFTLTAHYWQSATFLRRTRLIKRLWDELEILIKHKGLQERIIFALSDAAMGLRVRSAQYRHAAEVTKIVASRDLRAAVAAGFLIAEGERRGRDYKAADSLRQIALRIRSEEPGKIPDPFTEELLMTG
jgi:Fic family protein